MAVPKLALGIAHREWYGRFHDLIKRLGWNPELNFGFDTRGVAIGPVFVKDANEEHLWFKLVI